MRSKERETYTVTADATKANVVANILVSAIDACSDSKRFAPQDILFGMAMALAVEARRMGAVPPDVEKMLHICLDAPLVEIPASKGDA